MSKQEKNTEKNSGSLFQLIIKPLFKKGFKKSYNQFKENDQLPLFFMTVMGFGILVFGIINLLYWLWDDIVLIWSRFPDIQKIGIGNGIALILLLTGGYYYFWTKKTVSGTVLLFISLALNYLLFSLLANEGRFQELPVVIWLMMTLNTLLAYGLTLKSKEGRILSNLAVLGYTFALLQLFESDNIFYSLSIWSSFTIAFFIADYYKDRFLKAITTATAVLLLFAYLITDHSLTQNIFQLEYFHVLIITFSFLSFSDYQNNKVAVKFIKKADLYSILFFALPVTAFIVGIIYLLFSYDKNIPGLVLLINSLLYIFTVPFTQRKKHDSTRSVMLIAAAVFAIIGLAFIFLENLFILNLCYSTLALLLIYAGFQRYLPLIRFLGYIFLSLTLLVILFSFQFLNIEPKGELFTTGYLNLAYLGVIFGVLTLLLHFYKDREAAKEFIFKHIPNEIFSVWLAAFLVYTGWHISMKWFSLWLLFVAAILLYRGYIVGLKLSKMLGIISYVAGLAFTVYIIKTGITYKPEVLLSYGYGNLYLLGIYLIAAKYLIVFVNGLEFCEDKIQLKSIDFSDKQTERAALSEKSRKFFHLLNYLITFWFTIAFVVTTRLITNDWFSIFNLIPAYFLIFSGYASGKKIYHIGGLAMYMAFFIMALALTLTFDIYNLIKLGIFIVLVWATYKSIYYLPKTIGLKALKSKQSIPKTETYVFSSLFLHFKALFESIKSIDFGLKKIAGTRQKRNEKLDDRFSIFISVWIAAFFIITGIKYLNYYVFNIALIPLFLLTGIGGKRKLAGIEFLGLAHFIFMLTGMIVSIDTAGSIRLSQQPLFGKLLIIEIYAVLWFFQTFYEWFFPENPRMKTMQFLRKIAHILLPFAILFIGYRRFYEHLPYFGWLAVVATFILNEWSKDKFIYKELYFFIAIATGISVYFTGFNDHLAGQIALTGIVAWKGGFVSRIKKPFSYRCIPAIMYFYPVLLFYSAYIHYVERDYPGISFLMAAYLFMLVWFRDKIFALRTSHKLAFYSGFILMVVGIYLFYMSPGSIHDFQQSRYKFFSIAFMPLAFYLLTRIIYDSHRFPGTFLSQRWKIQTWVLHISYIVGYSALLGYLMQDWTARLITLGLIIHGVILVVNYRKKSFKPLRILIIIILGSALIKFFFWDLRTFKLIEKVLIFMLLGILFLGAAFYIRKKQMKQKESKEIDRDEKE